MAPAGTAIGHGTMRSKKIAASLSLLCACSAVVIACSEEGLNNSEACYPGDFEYADAGVALDGAQVTAYLRCSDDGAAYEPYDGDPNAISDSGADAYANCDLSKGLLTFMCGGCTTDDQCTTLHCYPFNNKGAHCSHSCASNNDCEPGSGGCGGTGFCKPL